MMGKGVQQETMNHVGLSKGTTWDMEGDWKQWIDLVYAGPKLCDSLGGAQTCVDGRPKPNSSSRKQIGPFLIETKKGTCGWIEYLLMQFFK